MDDATTTDTSSNRRHGKKKAKKKEKKINSTGYKLPPCSHVETVATQACESSGKKFPSLPFSLQPCPSKFLLAPETDRPLFPSSQITSASRLLRSPTSQVHTHPFHNKVTSSSYRHAVVSSTSINHPFSTWRAVGSAVLPLEECCRRHSSLYDLSQQLQTHV